jgi:hypothetical protein
MIGAPPPPSWRKPAGMFLIIGLIALWAFLIGSFSQELGALPGWAQIPIYIVTGINLDHAAEAAVAVDGDRALETVRQSAK